MSAGFATNATSTCTQDDAYFALPSLFERCHAPVCRHLLMSFRAMMRAMRVEAAQVRSAAACYVCRPAFARKRRSAAIRCSAQSMSDELLGSAYARMTL